MYTNAPPVRDQAARVPMGHFCEPEEFAHGALSLAHRPSGFITGEVPDLPGGLQLD